MLFVPIVPTVLTTSPNAQQLAQEIATLIRNFEQTHPGTTPGEIRQALDLVSAAGGGAATRKLIALAVALLLVAGLGAFLFVERGGDAAAGDTAWLLPVLIGVGVIVLGALLAWRR